MNNFTKNIDYIILGSPVLSCMGVGLAGGILQQKSYAPAKVVGWLGVHAAIVCGVASGLPLMVYSIAKFVFAKALNELTFRRSKYLNTFEEYSELQCKVTLFTISALPVIVLALPHVYKPAFKTYEKYKEFQKTYEEFKKSDLYNTLNTLYTQLNQIFKNQNLQIGPALTPNKNQNNKV